MSDQYTKTTPYQNLLIEEIKTAGVRLDLQPWLKADSVVSEIEFSIKPEIHEGQVQSYGVVLADSLDDFDRFDIVHMDQEHLPIARKMADGTDWFVLYEQSLFVGLVRFPTVISLELQILRRFPASGGMIIHRNQHGACRFYQGDQMVLHDRRNWIIKPDVKMILSNANSCIENMNKRALQIILEFAYHLISPTDGAGAILIWYLNDLHPKNTLERLELSFLNESHLKLLFHLIRQSDGATLINAQGYLIGTGYHLPYTTKSRKVIPNYKGTRHTSSIRYSFDTPNAVVITVSEDGPVSVFINGVNITQFEYESVYQINRKLKQRHPEEKEKILPVSRNFICKNCSKPCLAEGAIFNEKNGEIPVFCPTCKTIISTIHAHLLQVKPVMKTNSKQ